MWYLVSILLCATTSAHGSYRGYGGYGGYGGYYNYRQMDHCERPDFDGLIVTPIKDEYDHGETIQLSCEEGYKFTNKRRNSTCQVHRGFFLGRGVFMPGIFEQTCEELPLCRPPRVEGLEVEGDKTLFEEGENITISCDDGYELVGAETYTCQIRSGFYGKYATFGQKVRKACQEIQLCDPPIQDGLVIEPMKESYEPGENISLACEDGYEISVYETSTCQSSGYFRLKRIEKDDGKQRTREDFYIYFNQVCIQKAECKAPDFEGMIVSPLKDTYTSGDEITISCEEGYELKGANSSVCTDEHGRDIFSYIRRLHGYGSFSPKISSYTCVEKQQCPAPKAQPGLILTPAKDNYDIGETVELSCEEGYKLANQKSAKCISDKKFLRHWGRIWAKKVNQLSPWASSGLCEKTLPTETTSTETMSTESPETESSGFPEEDTNDLKKSGF